MKDVRWKIIFEVESIEDGKTNRTTVSRESEWESDDTASAFWCLGTDIGDCIAAVSNIIPSGQYRELPEGIEDCLREDGERWFEKKEGE